MSVCVTLDKAVSVAVPEPADVVMSESEAEGEVVDEPDADSDDDVGEVVATDAASIPRNRSKDSDNKHITREERLRRSRERNREHARRTRLRKKAQMAAMQKRVAELQEESLSLRQRMEVLCGARTNSRSPPAMLEGYLLKNSGGKRVQRKGSFGRRGSFGEKSCRDTGKNIVR